MVHFGDRLGKLHEMLVERRPQVLHFVGHGGLASAISERSWVLQRVCEVVAPLTISAALSVAASMRCHRQG